MNQRSGVFFFKFPDARINIFSLRFSDRDREKDYLQYLANRHIWQLRLANVLAMVFYFVAVTFESGLKDTNILSPSLRIIVVVPSFMTGLLISFIFSEFYKKHHRLFSIYYVLITGISFILTGMDAGEPYNYILYSGLMVSLIFNFTFIRQSFVNASIAGTLLVLSYIILQVKLQSPANIILHISIYILVTNFLGMFISYTMDFDSRRSYLLLKQTIKDASEIKDYSENLEHKIQIRTAELENAKIIAEESEKLKTAFLLNMSHEIRTPMNSIMGFADLLKEKNLNPQTIEKYAGIIYNGSVRMLNTIHDIMDMSLIESNNVIITISAVNINKLIGEIHELFRDEAKNKGIEMHIHLPLKESSAIIQTDEEKLTSIFSNLVKNAIKYSSGGIISIGYTPKKEEIVFYCRDQGMGIPENRKEAIFNRFVQADIEDRKVYQGNGLGLPICKSFVEIQGGRIRVSSKEGEGSEFIFTLPKKSSAEKK